MIDTEICYIGPDLFSEFCVSNIEECVEYLLQQKEVGVDIETSRKFKRGTYNENVYEPGLDPYVTRIVMLQIGTLEKVYVIDTRSVDITEIITKVIINPNITKVGMNLKFEGKHFLHNYGVEMRNVWDIMIAEKVLHNGLKLGYSLAALSYRYLNIKPVENINLFSKFDKQVDREVRKLRAKDEFGEQDEESLIAQAEQTLLQKEYMDKATRLGFINIEGKPFTIKQIKYGVDDVIHPLLIKKMQIEKGNGRFDIAFALENAITQVLADMEYRGVGFDPEKWIDLYHKNLKTFQQQEMFLREYVEAHHPEFTGTVDLFNAKPTCLIKWSSSQQVIKLFKKLNIAVKERSKSTGKMEWTVGATHLLRKLPREYKDKFFTKAFPEKINNKHDLTLAYLLYKKSEQLVTTFGKDFLKYIHPVTKRIHPGFNQYMHTGRLSSNKPNGQNIPNSADFRACFVEPMWFSADYKNQELRVLAQVSECQDLIDFFTVGHKYFGEDFHSYMATGVFKIIHNNNDYVVPPKGHPDFTAKHKDERTTSKSVTFKIIFGGQEYTLSIDLGVDIHVGKKFFDAFFDAIPGLRENFEKAKKNAVKTGKIQLDPYTNKHYYFPYMDRMKAIKDRIYELAPNYNKLSREQRYELPCYEQIKNLWREYFYYHGKLERRGLNFRIQGNAATMMKLALWYIHRWRWDNGYQEKAFITLPVHDEANGACIDPDLKNEFEQTIIDSMIKAGTKTCPDVPQGVDIEIDDHWVH